MSICHSLCIATCPALFIYFSWTAPTTVRGDGPRPRMCIIPLLKEDECMIHIRAPAPSYSWPTLTPYTCARLMTLSRYTLVLLLTNMLCIIHPIKPPLGVIAYLSAPRTCWFGTTPLVEINSDSLMICSIERNWRFLSSSTVHMLSLQWRDFRKSNLIFCIIRTISALKIIKSVGFT